jgi:hypothetical protein
MSNARYSLMGPAVLITVGTVFLIHQWRPELHIGRLWPVILIVIGIVRILESSGLGAGGAMPGTTQGTLPPPPPPAANPGPSSPGSSSTPGAGSTGPLA